MRLFAALCVGWILLEVALRLTAAGDVDARLAAALSALEGQSPWQATDEAASGETFAHPYLGYETVERHGQLVEQLAFIAALGDGRAEWEARHFVVLFVGGSVARYVGDPSVGGLDALAAELRDLPALEGREPFFLSAGRQAFKQPQQLLLVGYLLTLGLEPDAVVNLDGFNEVALGAGNVAYGVHPGWPSHFHAGHLGGTDVNDPAQVTAAADLWRLRTAARGHAERVASGPLRASVLARAIVAWRVERLAREAERARVRFRSARAARKAAGPVEPQLAPDGAAPLERSVELWVDGSLALDALCRGRGIRYLHVLQPALADAGSKPAAPAERAVLDELEATDGWTRAAFEGARAGYPRLREAGARLVAEGVAFVDASDVFAARGDAIYYDVCHFRRPGTELVGTRIGAELAALLARE